jgi:PAS domain S-box-containing protein
MRHDMHGSDEAAALLTVLEGTARETGKRFFAALVEHLARALGMHAAIVTEYVPETGRARPLGFFAGDERIEHREYDVDGTPCGIVLRGAQYVHCASDVQQAFPTDADLRSLGVVSYMGVPLLDGDGGVLGHLAVMDRAPMTEAPRHLALFHVFARRAAAELQRLRAEADGRERERRLGHLVEGVTDAIVELDAGLRVTMTNPAASRILGRASEDMLGREIGAFLAPGGEAALRERCAALEAAPGRDRWERMPDGLMVAGGTGEEIAVDAALSRLGHRPTSPWALVLRERAARQEAERTIAALAAEFLADELHDDGAILGRSPALGHVLDDVRKVAPTGATVLILGETGTGKELIARAVHDGSPRRDRPFLTVNCAAIAPTLIESELFGHEQGAFTGATRRREGRFALADGGTLLLDEVGELPLEAQAKLLRVLQEGEIERVGSSTPRRVDVRVVAATNRDLEASVARGEFREDLFYRLNVFPIRVPPLRERGDDVLLLATAFAARVATRLGRRILPLDDEAVARLRAHAWPGNVRELQNAIERGVIAATGERLNLDRALPRRGEAAAPPLATTGDERIRTVRELRELERANVLRALDSTGWRVSGDRGAAALLGVHPSTLSSRMKSLGIRRPS